MTNEYIGKICPYCKTEFKEGDDIVICSVCDMPHHKDCWIENQGCTTFGCMGTIKAIDGGASAVTETTMQYEEEPVSSPIYCTRCGSANASQNAFCSRCGNRLLTNQASHGEPHFVPSGGNPAGGYQAYRPQQVPSYQPPIQSPQQAPLYQPPVQSPPPGSGFAVFSDWRNSPDAAAYLGPNSEYYVSKFSQMQSQHKKASWNWPAFLISPYWFIYRKMYAYGAAILGANLILSFLGQIGSLLSLAGYIAIGIFANYLYMQQVSKNVAGGKVLTEPYKGQHIAKVGGVNSMAAVFAAIGYAVFTLIINLL